MSMLLIDLGNTRLKSIWWHHEQLQNAAAVDHSNHPSTWHETLKNIWQSHIKQHGIPHTITCVCVANQTIRTQLITLTTELFQHTSITWLTNATQPILTHSPIATIHNNYLQPERLGNDRWLLALGALSHIIAHITLAQDSTHTVATDTYNLMVASFGTATTIDLMQVKYLNQRWCASFEGGLIMPGLSLMLQSLGQQTALLPDLSQQNVDPYDIASTTQPRATNHAILCGCFTAQTATLKARWQLLNNAKHCIITGGAAKLCAPYLTDLSPIFDDHLMFKGMLISMGIHIAD